MVRGTFRNGAQSVNQSDRSPPLSATRRPISTSRLSRRSSSSPEGLSRPRQFPRVCPEVGRSSSAISRRTARRTPHLWPGTPEHRAAELSLGLCLALASLARLLVMSLLKSGYCGFLAASNALTFGNHHALSLLESLAILVPSVIILLLLLAGEGISRTVLFTGTRRDAPTFWQQTELTS